MFSVASWALLELTALPSLQDSLCSPRASSLICFSSSPTQDLSIRALPWLSSEEAWLDGVPGLQSPFCVSEERIGHLLQGCLIPCGLCPHRHKHALLFLLRQLQPSNARRSHCLALAIADIVWRAGGRERAVVTL